MGMSIVETLFDVGQKLFGLKVELAKARQARKQEVAGYLAAIAQTIEEANAELRQGTYPHGKCQELFVHSQNMAAAIGDLVGLPLANALGAQLAEVHEIERLHAELGADSDAERVRKLDLLDQAAGQFRATAAFVRVSP